jgi:hypothetical protein
MVEALRAATKLTQTRRPFTFAAMVVRPRGLDAAGRRCGERVWPRMAQCAALIAPYVLGIHFITPAHIVRAVEPIACRSN